MGRPSKKLKPKRTAAEFDLRRLAAALKSPRISPAAFAWLLENIRAARDDQMRGVFKMPAALAKSMRTDDALFNAHRNRLAPLRSLDVALVPASPSAAAQRIAGEAEALYGQRGVGVTTATLASVHSDLVNHNVAFGIVDAVPREDGSRVDLYMRHWPIEWVRWDPILRCFVTQVEQDEAAQLEAEAYAKPLGAYQIPIVHGDGRWVIFSKHETEPFAQDACLLPAALVWAARAFGFRDWARNSKAHGAAKMFGELPEGISLTDAEGNPTPQAAAFLEVIQAVMEGDTLAAIRPAGSKTEFVANASTNWQVFSELVTNRDKAAARIYLGTDGILGAQGGAPGVDISALFGIATTILQGDAECFEYGLFTGLLQPWAAINFGDSTLAPRREYQLPDVDAERWNEDFAKRNAAFHDAIKRTRENGFEITQDVVNALAKKYRVPAPTLPVESKRAPSIALAPTDLAVAVTVNEARASAGLGELTLPDGTPDPDGRKPLAAFKAKVEAQAKPLEAPSNGAPAKPNGAPAAAAS